VKILTACPSCLQGLSRYNDDAGTVADYIVVEIARSGCSARTGWPLHQRKPNRGGIERVLL
jgi:hypothetical protein